MKPTTLEEMTLTPEEEEALEADQSAAKAKMMGGGALAAKAALDEQDDPDATPSWARELLPEGLRIPTGRQVAFVRFQSSWTQAPHVGVPSLWPVIQPGVVDEEGNAKVELVEKLSRVLMLWTISDVEETMALKATRGERERTLPEQCKRMIRAVDGKIVDWTGNYVKNGARLASADVLWRELGKCRQPLLNMYLRMHTLDTAEMADFLVSGLVLASSRGG